MLGGLEGASRGFEKAIIQHLEPILSILFLNSLFRAKICPCRSTHGQQQTQDFFIPRSGSVPNLATYSRASVKKHSSTSPTVQRICTHHRAMKTGAAKEHLRILRGMQRTLLNKSVDEAGAYFPSVKMSLDSQSSIGRESYELLSNDAVFNKRDRNKRSDTAKRHILARQKQIDNFEMHTSNGKQNVTSNRRYVPAV